MGTGSGNSLIVVFMPLPWLMQPEFSYRRTNPFFRQFNGLGIQHEHVAEFPISFQQNIDALITHAALRLGQQEMGPRLG